MNKFSSKYKTKMLKTYFFGFHSVMAHFMGSMSLMLLPLFSKAWDSQSDSSGLTDSGEVG